MINIGEFIFFYRGGHDRCFSGIISNVLIVIKDVNNLHVNVI